MKFLDYYYKNNYLLIYYADNGNYYKNIKHITNNASESFNKYLNNLFPKKPFFYKLKLTLKKKNRYFIVIMKGELKKFFKKKAKIIS